MDKTFIIAEAGVNHNGSIEIAKRLIDIAAEAGADAVKFQTFKANKVISKFAEKADYQKQTTGSNESQLEMVRKLELDTEAHYELREYCIQQNIKFLSTPFDLDSADFLINQMKVELIKIPSGEITNAPLLLRIAQSGLPVILSSGMATLAEIEQALGVLAFGYTAVDAKPSRKMFQDAFYSKEGRATLQAKVSLLHCTTEYPTPYNDVNLRAIDTMAQAFGLSVGLSDHTEGIAVPIAAVARGAKIIEKHFTLDKTLPGPDHKASLDPKELKDMVSSIRQVEMALGSPIKTPAPSELKNQDIARKSLVASTHIAAGEIFTVENLTSKRPGTGISPMYFWDVLGTVADKDYQEDEVITYYASRV
ncbi:MULTISPECIES: N-acetylneuraminate synthase [Brevibacillus]|jgi:N-acetylneuraminate synthase|uniref:N-acetylneuraminate synthase n=1 Tax=Brevibacillus TaxID=55080 RepID=UPI00156AFD85|nr:MULTISPECIES: N-acetylneuraminate synthase [Brevibacillus]MBU8713675.1 N-acetylneuraminate synthase [Brevibacillus parabrevis]MED2256171.1 N-acetylneuraminate synthase [Brevibacillus parabrevis]UED68669.1 N-acetylneuraminate synthase [Brevibacillus sp. HD3.3A]WDV94958.1 N-acetylneuraminate synthase [Brevibacillus parabrevis]